MWDTFYTKVPIERAYLWYVEQMPHPYITQNLSVPALMHNPNITSQ